jgi:predicted naringenin-chalcone synthase
MPVLSDFVLQRPAGEIDQRRLLDWLLDAHLRAARATGEATPAFEHRIKKIVSRCACSPAQIGSRGYTLEDASEIYDVDTHPHGKPTLARMAVYERAAETHFEALYAEDADAPDDIVHVTCTGYASPSAAQRLVARRGWNSRTRVTHAYHMGCYAAFPALRIAEGCLRTSNAAAPRVDLVHTELCTLHLDPSRHEMEDIVVQSLFADGCVKYTLSDDAKTRGLRIVASAERIVPDSVDSMRWVMSEWGMQMTLTREVPEKVGGVLRDFVTDLLARADLSLADLPKLQLAVHPGGPRIIDGVRESLELDESQVAISRAVLFDYGNMSSATLPHVWKRMLDSDDVAKGTRIVSLAFGPGVTVCGLVLEKQ